MKLDTDAITCMIRQVMRVTHRTIRVVMISIISLPQMRFLSGPLDELQLFGGDHDSDLKKAHQAMDLMENTQSRHVSAIWKGYRALVVVLDFQPRNTKVRRWHEVSPCLISFRSWRPSLSTICKERILEDLCLVLELQALDRYTSRVLARKKTSQPSKVLTWLERAALRMAKQCNDKNCCI